MRPLFVPLTRFVIPALLVAHFVGTENVEAGKSPGPTASSNRTEKVPAQLAVAFERALKLPGEKLSLPRDVQLLVREGAKAAPKFTTQLPVGPRGAKLPVQTVQVDEGQVEAIVSSDAPSRGVLLQGPHKILGITTGGRMLLSVTGDAVTVAAVTGDVLVGHDSKFRPLPEGNMRIFSTRTGAVREVALPPSVQISTASGLTRALSGPSQVSLSTKNAKDELLVALTDQHGQRVGSLQRFAPGAPIELTIPHAGTYYAAARTIDPNGICGAVGAPAKIQVMGLAPGERPARDGIFLLDRGERLRLAGTEGLEMRYGTSSTFVSATSSIGLSQDRPTDVEFRKPGDPSSSIVLRLAPRIMQTSIELGPADARWPGKPVELFVGMRDGAGRVLGGDELDVQVTVNARPVPVSWRSTPDGLRSELSRQGGEGPWVVRVNVNDDRGHTVARDFLEVAAQ